MKVIITFTFCCDNLWKNKLMALEKPGKIRIFFSYFEATLFADDIWCYINVFDWLSISVHWFDDDDAGVDDDDSDDISYTPVFLRRACVCGCLEWSSCRQSWMIKWWNADLLLTRLRHPPMMNCVISVKRVSRPTVRRHSDHHCRHCRRRHHHLIHSWDIDPAPASGRHFMAGDHRPQIDSILHRPLILIVVTLMLENHRGLEMFRLPLDDDPWLQNITDLRQHLITTVKRLTWENHFRREVIRLHIMTGTMDADHHQLTMDTIATNDMEDIHHRGHVRILHRGETSIPDEIVRELHLTKSRLQCLLAVHAWALICAGRRSIDSHILHVTCQKGAPLFLKLDPKLWDHLLPYKVPQMMTTIQHTDIRWASFCSSFPELFISVKHSCFTATLGDAVDCVIFLIFASCILMLSSFCLGLERLSRKSKPYTDARWGIR